MIDWNLQGKTIAVPEMRELEVFSALLERRGANVLRCPLVSIYDSPHSAQVLAFAVNLAEGGFDDFVLITGEGLTRILSCIDKYEPALRPRFIAGLGKLRTITRGPKPARALRVIGLKPGIEATEPTTDGVIRAMSTQPARVSPSMSLPVGLAGLEASNAPSPRPMTSRFKSSTVKR